MSSPLIFLDEIVVVLPVSELTKSEKVELSDEYCIVIVSYVPPVHFNAMFVSDTDVTSTDVTVGIYTVVDADILAEGDELLYGLTR